MPLTKGLAGWLRVCLLKRVLLHRDHMRSLAIRACHGPGDLAHVGPESGGSSRNDAPSSPWLPVPSPLRLEGSVLGVLWSC